MEIVRSSLRAGDIKRANLLHLHRNYILLILQLPFDNQKWLMHHGDVIFLEYRRRDDGVGDSRLIFNAKKNETFRGPGTLAANHGSGDSHAPPIRHIAQLHGS